MDTITRKVCGMTMAFIVTLVILFTGVSLVFANHENTSCGVNKAGQPMFADEPDANVAKYVPCDVVLDKQGNPHLGIFDQKGELIEAWSMDFAKKVRKKVWAKGQQHI